MSLELEPSSQTPNNHERNAAFRKDRHLQEYRRLRANVLALVTADPRIELIGTDQLLEEARQQLYIGDGEVAIVRVRWRRRILTLVAVPNRHWYGAFKGRLLALRDIARKLGHRTVLVPERVVKREPRLANSISIARYRQFTPALRDVLAVQSYLADQGSSSLQECLELVRDGDPAATVLQMVSAGVIGIDLNRRITATTRVVEIVDKD